MKEYATIKEWLEANPQHNTPEKRSALGDTEKIFHFRKGPKKEDEKTPDQVSRPANMVSVARIGLVAYLKNVSMNSWDARERARKLSEGKAYRQTEVEA